MKHSHFGSFSLNLMEARVGQHGFESRLLQPRSRVANTALIIAKHAFELFGLNNITQMFLNFPVLAGLFSAWSTLSSILSQPPSVAHRTSHCNNGSPYSISSSASWLFASLLWLCSRLRRAASGLALQRHLRARWTVAGGHG